MHKIKKNNKTNANNEELTGTFNAFFSNMVPNLNIDNNLRDDITNPNITDPVFCTIEKHENHSNIVKIK